MRIHPMMEDTLFRDGPARQFGQGLLRNAAAVRCTSVPILVYGVTVLAPYNGLPRILPLSLRKKFV